MINERARRQLFQLNKEAWTQVSAAALPQSVKSMVYFHIQGPWISNFLAVAIAPLRPGLEGFLHRPVFEYEALSFHYPSMDWWLAHAKTSHPPDGAGCDIEAHVNFLTAYGADQEFVYANILKSGDVAVLERPDFEDECAFWEAGTKA